MKIMPKTLPLCPNLDINGIDTGGRALGIIFPSIPSPSPAYSLRTAHMGIDKNRYLGDIVGGISRRSWDHD